MSEPDAVAICPACEAAFCAEHLREHDPKCPKRPHGTWGVGAPGSCDVCGGRIVPRPLHERLGCLGYFGFGSGYGEAAGWLGPEEVDPATGAVRRGLYCNVCPLAVDCWRRHQARVRRLFPDLAEAFDRFLAKYADPREAAARFALAMHAEGIESPVEPYTLVMRGNLLDGRAVAETGRPTVRGGGKLTLPWPFPAPPGNLH